MSVNGVIPNKSSFLLCSGGIFIHRRQNRGPRSVPSSPSPPAAWGSLSWWNKVVSGDPHRMSLTQNLALPRGPVLSIEWRRAEGSLSER